MDTIITPNSVLPTYRVNLHDGIGNYHGTYTMEQLEHMFGLYGLLAIIKGYHSLHGTKTF